MDNGIFSLKRRGGIRIDAALMNLLPKGHFMLPQQDWEAASIAPQL